MLNCCIYINGADSVLVQVLHPSKNYTLQLVSDSSIDPKSLHILLEPTNRDSALEEEQ